MKAVILAGGLGSRLSEETQFKPKPMVELGGKPILWHIMKIYSQFGINEFIICSGYKGHVIKEYFQNYHLYNSDVTFDIKNNTSAKLKKTDENWKVTIVDTGADTSTGGRLKRVKEYLKNENNFCLTYGDGLAKFNMYQQFDFHKKNKKICTVLAVRPPSRYGALKVKKSKRVTDFNEKPVNGEAMINGGFFVLSTKCFKYIKNDKSIWETDVLTKLAKANQLIAYDKYNFWHPMDTIRDQKILNEMWSKNMAAWKNWK
jgi:glucose-1-phosphate cytidylyltransferase